MNDQALREGVILLFARDEGLDRLVAEVDRPDRPPLNEALLRARCRQALWERLLDGVDLRGWISRLARDLFLTEPALEEGLGLEDAVQFWSWFDQTMWAQPALGSPEHLQVEAPPPAEPAEPVDRDAPPGQGPGDTGAGAVPSPAPDPTRSSRWNSVGGAGPDV